MATAADAEIVGRLGNVEVAEEIARHFPIEVLSGMNDRIAQSGLPRKRTADRGRLDELGPCTQNGDDSCSAHDIRALLRHYGYPTSCE